jgi:hypothetical protein
MRNTTQQNPSVNSPGGFSTGRTNSVCTAFFKNLDTCVSGLRNNLTEACSAEMLANWNKKGLQDLVRLRRAPPKDRL